MFRNLLAGVRLAFFLPLQPGSVAPSWQHVVMFVLFSAALWTGLDWLLAEPGTIFSVYGLQQLAWLASVFAGCVVMMLPPDGATGLTERVSTALTAVLPFFVLIVFALGAVQMDSDSAWWSAANVSIPFVVGIAWTGRVLHSVAAIPRFRSFVTAVIVVLAMHAAFTVTVEVRPQVWYSPQDAQSEASAMDVDAEELLYRQPELIDRAVARLEPGIRGRPEVYFLGFAGDGTQGVFAKEVRFAHSALARKYDLTNHSIDLLNTDEDEPAEPLATGAGLRRALAGIGGRMNVDEDALVLFLTSHGSEDGELYVARPGLTLTDLSPEQIAQALRESGIKWRILVVSACYSGQFIEPLQDDYTFIVTASRGDRTSFGCGDDRDLTYFGEAFFRDALPASRSWTEAAERARKAVTERESAEDFTPSQPQIFVGTKMRGKLAQLQFQPNRP